MYICNIAYIYQNWNNIYNVNINELGTISTEVKHERKESYKL